MLKRPATQKAIAICLAAFFGVVACSRQLLANTEPNGVQPISAEEFLDLFKSGKAIEKREIQASVIIEALQFAQDAASANQTLPPRLEIRESVIVGDIKSELLRETKVRALPPALRERYRRFYLDGIRIVPIPIVITGTVFQGMVVLRNIVFEGLAVFTSSVFQGAVFFSFDTFEAGADFAAAKFQQDVSFGSAEFQGDADFDSAHFFARADFNSAKFLDQASFDSNLDKEASFFEAIFVGDADLSFNFASLQPPKGDLHLFRAVFQKSADFSGLTCLNAKFDRARFRGPADFRYSKVSTLESFGGTIFEDEADFFFATFPLEADQAQALFPEKGLELGDVQFKKAVHLNWDQLVVEKPWWQFWRGPKLKVNRGGIRTWEALEEAFGNSGNLEGQNEAMYQRRLVEPHYRGYNKDSNDLSFLFWGYGIRPWRVIGWMMLVNLLFGLFYWTQTTKLETAGNKWQSRMDRLRFTTAFTLKTFWKFTYGFQNSTTPLFKTLTLVHSILSKVMLVCLLNVISHVSPLLNEIVGKLLPV